MRTQTVESAIRSILIDMLGLSNDEIHYYSRLDADLGLDSYGKLELVHAIQENFGLNLIGNLESFPKISTVGEVVAYIESVLN